MGVHGQLAVPVDMHKPASELSDRPGHWSERTASPLQSPEMKPSPTPPCITPLPVPAISSAEALLPRPCQWLWIHSLYPEPQFQGRLCSFPPFVPHESCTQPTWGRGEGILVCSGGASVGSHHSPHTFSAPSCPQAQPTRLPDYSDHDRLLLKAVHGSLLPFL